MKNNQIYSDKLGINTKELSNSYLSLIKIGWEQVLLIAIYARQQYLYLSDTEREKEGFHQRIKLIHSANKDDLLTTEILDKIEAGCGSNEIIKILFESIVPETINCNSTRLLQIIENKNIAFKSTKKKFRYTYFGLYKILNDPLSIFQSLLEIPNLDIEEKIKLKLMDYLRDEHPRELRFLPKDKDELSYNWKYKRNVNEIISDIEKGVKSFDKTKFSHYLNSELLKKVSEKVNNAYSQLQHSSQKEKNLSLVESRSVVGEKLTLSLNKQQLDKLIGLGQLDSIMSSLKEVLLEQKTTRKQAEVSEVKYNCMSLEALCSWYSATKAEIIKKIEQCPKLIASILEFDIRYRLGFCDLDIGSFNIESRFRGNLSSKDFYKISTFFIHNTLFYKNDHRCLIDSLQKVTTDDFLKTITRETTPDQASLSANQMMKNWATLEEKSIIERFKKLPPYLKINKTKPIDSLICLQQEKSKNDAPSYPVNSPFPLPLWAV
ncbi:hypothetical protein Q4493_15425 [Colwellia sp. 1_MG-2023]|uniref:hypothetical protein n=1 Tax=Colwellia sp. 1_MG-2023 TaxID=3062649 RepID=UPI0026E1DC9A|nr:hypothetical protein [Colwellia sp. 1_MG-2023]MDO6447161.1 hypothetical protein [Colwellia sp. 1_MG-2023]